MKHSPHRHQPARDRLVITSASVERRLLWRWAVAALLFVTAVAVPAAEPNDVPPAPPKKGRLVDPPLSANIPDAWSQLPQLATIEWETRHLPWVDEGPYAGISGVAMAADGDRIYVAGGFIPGGDETEDMNSRRTSRWTWMLNTSDDSWQRLPDAPVRREYTRGIVADSAFYIIGGGCQYRQESTRYRVHGDVARLDTATTPPTWSHHSALQVPRTHTAIGRIGPWLIVAGGNEYDSARNGYSPETIRDTCEVFNLTKPDSGWQQKQPIPGPGRGWCASTVANDRLYLFGGLTWTAPGVTPGLRDTLIYDPQTDRWDSATPSPLAVSGWEGALWAGRYVLMTGGVVRSTEEPMEKIIWSDLVWAWDVQEDRWLRVSGSLPPGAVFNDPGVAIVDDTIYVLGAEGPHGSHYDYLLVGRISITEP